MYRVKFIDYTLFQNVLLAINMTTYKKARSQREYDLDKFRGKEASEIIKVAMKRKGVKSPQLAEMLTHFGRPIGSQGLRNRLSDGNFKASWFLDVLHLLETDKLILDE